MKKVLLSALMALMSIGSQAQQTIDVYKTVKLPPMDGITLVTVNKAKFNIYEKPNGKRRAEPWGAPGEYIVEYGPSLFGVKMHPTGWAYIFSGSESGFASPKDFHKATLTPFEPWMFNTAEAAFNDGQLINTWRIAINKATGLVLKEWGIDNSRQNLGIGRLKDNSLVIILKITSIDPQYIESANSISIKEKKDESDNIYYELVYGKNNAIKTNRGIRLNLETIPADILSKLFLPVDEYFGEYREIVKEWKDIEYSQWDGIDYYNDAVNAELMSAPFVNEQTAIAAHNTPTPNNNNNPGDGNQIGDDNGNPENPDNDSIMSQKRNFAEFNIIEFASQMIQLNDFGKIREQALAKSFKPSTDDNKYFSAKRTIGKKENIHTDRFSKKDPKVYVVSTFVSELDDNEIISTLQRLGYTETEVKNSTIAGAPRATRIYQHRSGQHYVEFDIMNSSTGKTIKELKYRNK